MDQLDNRDLSILPPGTRYRRHRAFALVWAALSLATPIWSLARNVVWVSRGGYPEAVVARAPVRRQVRGVSLISVGGPLVGSTARPMAAYAYNEGGNLTLRVRFVEIPKTSMFALPGRPSESDVEKAIAQAGGHVSDSRLVHAFAGKPTSVQNASSDGGGLSVDVEAYSYDFMMLTTRVRPPDSSQRYAHTKNHVILDIQRVQAGTTVVVGDYPSPRAPRTRNTIVLVTPGSVQR